MERRDRFVAQSLGVSLTRRIKNSRVLLVGAGGIGCELLKNLVCCGFGTSAEHTNDAGASRSEIVVVDLDTIDLSNLNRQFLFRKQHIKRPKAHVAKETASCFNPSVRIDAHHASIFDRQYNVQFFESFDLVFNALDNLAARRHVNRMCLAAKVTLIESGTTGFNGQVQVIHKDLTECYDCNPKPVQKAFPICTIRSTPSQSIHSIVWAKSYLLPELFSTNEDGEDSSNVVVTENDNAEEVAKLREEAEALKKIRGFMGKDEFAKQVFNKVFHDDIERLRSMKEMWKSRRPPESIGFENLSLNDIEAGAYAEAGRVLSERDQLIWDLKQNVLVFCYSLEALSQRMADGETSIEFDKDDKDTLDFVASAANLRSHIFGIPLHSAWEIKQMAGNIIPAIATSNALTASLCVLEAFKVFKSLPGTHNVPETGMTHGRIPQQLGGAKMVFLNSRSTERMILPQALVGPNPHCPVCSPFYAKLQVSDPASSTLRNVVELVKSQVGLGEFAVVSEAGILYDPDLDDNLEKPLSDLGFDGENNTFLSIVDDDDEETKVDLMLSVIKTGRAEGEEVAASNESLQLLPSSISLPLKSQKVEEAEEPDTNGVPAAAETTNLGKRKRDDEDDVTASIKKSRGEGEEAGTLVIEDDGAIVLDD